MSRPAGHAVRVRWLSQEDCDRECGGYPPVAHLTCSCGWSEYVPASTSMVGLHIRFHQQDSL